MIRGKCETDGDFPDPDENLERPIPPISQMPRFARVVVPDCPHHVTQRGNMRRDVFLTPSDKRVYLKLLRQYSALYSLQVLGYCLMSNQVHLIVAPADER